MNITLTNTSITQDVKTLAFEKNNGVDVINITVDTDESWQYKIDVKYPDKCCTGESLYNIIDLARTGNVCTVTLTQDMLPFNGKYTMQLRGINGDKVYHSETFDCWVKYSIDPAQTYDPVPSEFYQLEKELDDKITEINSDLTDYVSVNEQHFTDEQKQQARKNIGAGSSDFSGSYNDLTDKPALEAGKGYYTVQSTTPLTNEVTGTYGIALGGSNRVNALYGFTHGTLNKIAEGADKGVGIGTRNIVKGNTGIALGRDNNANSKGALALGNNATADGEASAALGGYNTLAKEDYQVAIGTNNAPNEAASVIIGAGNETSRQNVATFLQDGGMTLGGKFIKSTFNNNTHKAIGYWDVPKNFTYRNVQLNTAYDNIAAYMKGSDIHATETGWYVNGVNNAGGIRSQMLIRQAPRTAQGKDWPIVQIEKGKRYKFSFEVIQKDVYPIKEEDINFWLTADNSTICYTTTQQKNDALLYESGHIKINSDNWTKVTVTIDNAAHSGNLRLGICGVELDYRIFILRNIKIWEDPDDGVAVYHYKSYGSDINKDPNGVVDKYLYKIGDCQAIDNAQWLKDNRNITEFNTDDPETSTTFINTDAYSPTTEYGDARNYYGGTEDNPLVVCVDRIVPYKHDVLERGIYVDPVIFTVDYDEWVDSKLPIMPGTTDNSIAIGSNLNTSSAVEGQMVVGRYNAQNDSAVFIVGNGTSNSAQKNAFTVNTDNSISIGNTKLTEAQLKQLLALLNTNSVSDKGQEGTTDDTFDASET